MANVRLARFISEVAPPQLVSVMRNRASKMLDTIHEEEREAAATTTKLSLALPSSSASTSSSLNTTQQLLIKNVHKSFSHFHDSTHHHHQIHPASSTRAL